MTDSRVTPQAIEGWCEIMHDAYEEAAAANGWETQRASRKPWSDVPEANKATMRAAVTALAPLLCQPLQDENERLRAVVEAVRALALAVNRRDGAYLDEFQVLDALAALPVGTGGVQQ